MPPTDLGLSPMQRNPPGRSGTDHRLDPFPDFNGNAAAPDRERRRNNRRGRHSRHDAEQ